MFGALLLNSVYFMIKHKPQKERLMPLMKKEVTFFFLIILNCVQLQKLCCGQKLLNIFIKEFCKTIQKIEI
jgi:hypothetical protein